MLTDAEKLARRFDECFPKGGNISDAEIAAACGGVTKQAVGGWRKTGRIAKKHISVLSKLSGQPVEWWLGITPAATGKQKSAAAFAQSATEGAPGPTTQSPLIVAASRLDAARHVPESMKHAITELIKAAVSTPPTKTP